MEEFQQTAKLVEQEVAPEGSEMQASMLSSKSLTPMLVDVFGEKKKTDGCFQT